MTKNKSNTIKYSIKATLPIMAGYIVLGMGFGILLQSKGYEWWWALLMSFAIYAGSMQYVTIDLLAGGTSLISAALMTLLVNARHLFYGITMLEKYKDTGAKKPYLIFALTDETFSLVCSPNLPNEINRKEYYLFVSLFDQCYWIVGSLLGSIIGNAFSFNTTGVDFAMTALFVVIFVVSFVTIALRFLPFWVFRNNTPQVILYLGKVLPYAIMAMLIVYCLKNVSFVHGSHGIPEAISILLVVLLHKWKHNTLLSILLGTIAYMLLIQMAF